MGLSTGTIGPIFEHYGDVNHANTLSDSMNWNGVLYTTDTVGNLYAWSLTTLQQIGSTTSVFANGFTSLAISSFALFNGPSAFCTNQTNNNLVVVELNTGYKTTYTAAFHLPVTTTARAGLMAANPTANIVVWGTSTAGQFAISNGFVITTYTPAALSGATVLSCQFKDDTATFLLGTNKGTVVEVDGLGNVKNTITLPTTPNAGTSPVHVICGLSYYNNFMLAVTGSGVLYHYQYSTATVLTQAPYNGDCSGNNMAICTGISGITFISNGSTSTSYGLMCVDINASSMISYDVTIIDAANAGCVFVGFDLTTKRGWIASRDSKKLRIFDFKNIVELTTDTTRTQDPIAIDIPVQLIRFLRRRPGTVRLDFNSNIPAGINTIGCRKQCEYVEVAIEASPRKVDVRLTST